MESKESIGRLLGCLHRQAQKYLHREFSKLELGSGTHLFLMLLHHQDGITQNELTTRAHIDKAHTTRAIQRLVELGYISREKDEHDQRAYRIFLTDKAHKIMPEIKRVLKMWTAIISNGFSETEVKQTLSLLSKMSENAVKYMEDQG